MHPLNYVTYAMNAPYRNNWNRDNYHMINNNKVTNSGFIKKLPLSTTITKPKLSKLKQMRILDKLLVFGYLRNQENEHQTIIPDAIQILCLFHFYIDDDIFEYFVPYNFVVNEKKNQITLLNNQSFCTIYGRNRICTINSTQRHIWKYKILHTGRQTAIGIDSETKKWINDCFVGKKESTNYAYCSDGDIEGHDYKNTRFDEGCYSGHIVSFCLDLKNKNISIEKKDDNRNKANIAFKNVILDDYVCMAVYLGTVHDKVELLEYSCQG